LKSRQSAWRRGTLALSRTAPGRRWMRGTTTRGTEEQTDRRRLLKKSKVRTLTREKKARRTEAAQGKTCFGRKTEPWRAAGVKPRKIRTAAARTLGAGWSACGRRWERNTGRRKSGLPWWRRRVLGEEDPQP
jgi:hypothetical protein